MEEVFCQHPQDEEKAIYRVWDDDIREDGVGMPAACTAEPRDTDFPIDSLSMHEVSHGAHVRAMGYAVPFGAAPRACLVFPRIREHIFIKKLYGCFFIRISLQNREFFLIIVL